MIACCASVFLFLLSTFTTFPLMFRGCRHADKPFPELVWSDHLCFLPEGQVGDLLFDFRECFEHKLYSALRALLLATRI